MRVTKQKLKKIIQEELQKVLKEHPMPHAHRHREDPLDPFEATLETTLWPLEGDLVYPALGNLPASMYGPGGTGPEAQFPYGHYGTDPEQEWPAQWAPVGLIPGLTPEETAAYYEIDPVTGAPISHTPNVGIEDPGFIPESLQKIIQEELQKLLYEEESVVDKTPLAGYTPIQAQDDPFGVIKKGEREAVNPTWDSRTKKSLAAQLGNAQGKVDLWIHQLNIGSGDTEENLARLKDAKKNLKKIQRRGRAAKMLTTPIDVPSGY